MKKFSRSIIVILILFLAGGIAEGQKRISIGDNMPGFYLKDIDGKDFYSKSFFANNPGMKAAVFLLCASYCKPCKKEIPCLEDIYKKYEKSGLSVFLVAVEKESDASKIIDITGTKLPLLVDRYSLLPKLTGNEGIPMTVLVDREWKIKYLISGFSENRSEEIMKGLESEILVVINSAVAPAGK